MKQLLILGLTACALCAPTGTRLALGQPAAQEGKIEPEKLALTGWDPDEPVPAHVYYQKGKKSLPVVIFVHGLGGSKDQYVRRMQELAAQGLFVVAIDAHLHGERKVPGIFPAGKSLGALGEDYSIWVHQSAVAHTARDIARIIDALSARPEVDPARIGVAGVSMGSSTCMVLAWREPRVSVVVGLIGAVDFWYDVTKTPPGPDQDAKRNGLSPRVRQLVDSLNPRDRKSAIAPKALFLANGARDKGIDIESVRGLSRTYGRATRRIRIGWRCWKSRKQATALPILCGARAASGLSGTWWRSPYGQHPSNCGGGHSAESCTLT